jgi:anti-sigma regulatory factor (Ser/Thr protein kinase)
MTGRSELRINRRSYPGVTRDMRHALMAFLAALGVDRDRGDDVQTAVGEVLANAVEHAYEGTERGEIELFAHVSNERDVLAVDVFDRGTFIERDARPGRGFGLRIAQAIVSSLSIEVEDGTRVRMLFDLPARDAAAAS